MKLVSKQNLRYEPDTVLAELQFPRKNDIEVTKWLEENNYFYELSRNGTTNLGLDPATRRYTYEPHSKLKLRCTESDLLLFMIKFG